MRCNDKEAAGKLADYFSGHLSSAERDRVKNHLSRCPECRVSLKIMSLLAGRSRNPNLNNSEGHLTPEQLTIYYENRESLEKEVLERIESHLKACPRCSYDLNFLVSTEKELEDSVVPITSPEPAFVRFLGKLLMLIRKPAFAYLLLLLTLYPAAMWLFRRDQGLSPDTAAYLPNREYMLVEQRRSVGDIPILYRSVHGSLIAVAVPYHHFQKEFSYRISFSDGNDSSPLELETITDFSQADVIRVIIQTQPIPDGMYLLVISEIDRKDISDTLRSTYLFQVKTKE
jgi:hypothetical protein